MEVEQLQIRDFLGQCAPLVGLSDAWLNELILAIEIEYVRRDSLLYRVGEVNSQLRLIRQGAVEVTKADGALYGRFSDGDWVGYRSLLTPGGVVSLNVKTIEDTLFYVLPGSLFNRLVSENERVRQYFSERKPERLRTALQELNQEDYSLLSTHLIDLARPALSVAEHETIRDTACYMTVAKSKTALIIDAQQKLTGIVTDQDFRSRVIAKGRNVEDPISSIMTSSPLFLAPNESASEALLLMARRNIRHIPIIGHDKIHGIVSAADLLRQQSHNAVYLVGDIYAAEDRTKLARLSQHLPQALVRMVGSGLPPYDIGHAISSIGQAIMRRLILMAEEKFGAPPIPYTFIVAGSMARREQTAHSDQDSGMILSDEFDPAVHDEYFQQVAQFVSDGMDECGYIYCPGDIMATNTKWRQPLKVWREYFRQWIMRPEPQALLYSSIFFDLRWIAGEESLLVELRKEVLGYTKTQSLFQAHLAANALTFHPPLGFFKGFILEKHGTDEKAMDMKTRGVTPIIDLARVLALAHGLPELNTYDRLRAVGQAGGLDMENVEDLLGALDFISSVRLKHQAKQIEMEQKPDNYVSPNDLSPFERRHLKDAFEVVSHAQDSLSRRYQTGQFR